MQTLREIKSVIKNREEESEEFDPDDTEILLAESMDCLHKVSKLLEEAQEMGYIHADTAWEMLSLTMVITDLDKRYVDLVLEGDARE